MSALYFSLPGGAVVSWKRVAFSIIFVLIFVLAVFFAVRNAAPFQETAAPPPEMTPAQQAAAEEFAALPAATVRTEIPTTAPTPAPPGPAPGPTPRFFGSVKYGANRSSALNEEQAWTLAAEAFGKAGIADIRASEVISLGQRVIHDAAGGEEVVWSFQVNRTAGGTGTGGVAVIDAHDGHVVSFDPYP
ncbi:MAG TPA: hypothetical protein VMT44_03525 [Methanoregula sp.]|nr:hypothetical protein [Methanoregula sp.]